MSIKCTEPAHAEDVVQDTFVAAYQSINSFNNQSKLLTWFLGIARNKVRNEFNRSGKFRSQTISDDVLPEHQAREASPLEVLDQKQVYYELKLAIDQLSQDLQEALILVVMEGLSYEDVSKIMSIPVGTVKSKVFRARKTLKEKMEK